MRRQDFYFDLPQELIAQVPLAERSASRLMALSGGNGAVVHRQFKDVLELLAPEDLLVFNDTKVLPARLYGVKQTGGRVEILLERILANGTALAHLRASKSPKPGASIFVVPGKNSEATDVILRIVDRDESLFVLDPGESGWFEILRENGHMPLPPYIERLDSAEDQQRYQTVFAKREGAVAAPTAGLHFDECLLSNIRAKGVAFAGVTLHVGAGTFRPVRVENITEHQMHKEYIEVSEAVVAAVIACQSRGGRVVAVGTTTVRSLESAAAQPGGLASFEGDSDIFIYPGRPFRVVDAMITNFHLPESTLIMLVSAFAGTKNVLNAYEEAIRNRYRFFSYGDAMFVTPSSDVIGMRGDVSAI